MAELPELFEHAEQKPGRLIDKWFTGAPTEPVRYSRTYHPDWQYADDVMRYKKWDESLHPRGQPDNAGQFAEKPGGATATQPQEQQRPQTQQPQPQQQAGQQQQKHPSLVRAEAATAAASHKLSSITALVKKAMQSMRLTMPVEMRSEVLAKWDALIPEPKSDADIPGLISRFMMHPHVRAANAMLATMSEQIHGDPAFWTKTKYTSTSGKYIPEREALHQAIADKILTDDTRAKAGERPQAVFLIGAPASGKSTAGRAYIDSHGVKFANLNSDGVKENLPEYEGWNAAAVHEESSDVLKQVLQPRAARNKHNVVFDVVGSNTKKTLDTAREFAERGYDIHIVHVKVPTYISAWRLATRFLKNSFGRNASEKEPGRFVPPSYALSIGQMPDETYNAFKDAPFVKSWVQLDNYVPKNTPPKVLDQGKR